MARRLGTADAVVIGLGSIIGAGVFAAFAPAAAAAGTGLLIGLAIAGFVAYCNATSSAALAATYPTSGGTYLYGRDRLGPWWGFTTGWGFVIGKTASCAAMALTLAAGLLFGPLLGVALSLVGTTLSASPLLQATLPGLPGAGDHRRDVRLNRPAAPLLTHAPPRCGLCPGTQDSSRVMSRNQGRATPQ